MIKIVIEKIFQIAILTCAALLINCTSSAHKAKEEEKEKPESLLQRTRIEASSEEELLEKIRGLNWDEIPWGKAEKDEAMDTALR